MPLYSVDVQKSPEDAIEAAVAFFGDEGLSLHVEEWGSSCVHFTGGGGFVWVTASGEDEETTVVLQTREWDYQVRRFMREIG